MGIGCGQEEKKKMMVLGERVIFLQNGDFRRQYCIDAQPSSERKNRLLRFLLFVNSRCRSRRINRSEARDQLRDASLAG